jgi:hypothetical protein
LIKGVDQSSSRCVDLQLNSNTSSHTSHLAPHISPSAKKLGYNASSFAFTNNVPVFMQLADVVVCKPGTHMWHLKSPQPAIFSFWQVLGL